ncbi:MAG: tRNA 4-thiouridine(8) synthase ThiI [Oligoflexia bacterium]|nr:tRNA 4-thiouridine(8) synthase ThiI [Oligoflexia bacterium]
MNTSGSKIAVGLFSGGLDSMVSAMLVKKQGFKVFLLHFVSVFFGHKGEKFQEIKKTMSGYGMELMVDEPGSEYIEEILLNPRHGYGKAINPCIDCHAYMFKTAGEYMKKLGADFVFSGEVLGQRPMSQHKAALKKVETESGLTGLILRPLSAKLLQPTIPEQKGLINRELLMGIEGRGRSEQKKLAKEFGITEYPQPAGGCRLTDQNLKTRFEILKRRMGDDVTWDDLDLMCFGRHLKLSEEFYMVIPRDLTEGERIEKYLPMGLTIMSNPDIPGPMALLVSKDGKTIPEPGEEIIQLAASIVARYTKLYQQGVNKIPVNILLNNEKVRSLNVIPADDEQITRFRI